MNPMWRLTLAAVLAAGVAPASFARAQLLVTEAPAVYRGPFTCATKFPGSFLDIGTAACWQCPSTHPRRTIFAVTAGNACERPAQTLYRRAAGPENPTGLLRTDCRSGWFLDIGRGRCYSCSGYNRTAESIDSPRACSRHVAPAWASATRRGVEGCPAGAFRNGLTAKCYACPPDYSRNALIADDLTKINACSRISTGVREATHSKYEQQKNDHPDTKANLTRAAAPSGSVPDVPPVVRTPQDKLRHDQMVAILDDELKRNSGFVVVSWKISSSVSVGAGYARGEGYAMSKVGNVYACRKISSDAFTAGISGGAGVTEEIGLSQSPLAEGASETNGWQAGITVGLGVSYGQHWDAGSGKKSLAWSLGVAPAAELSGDYVHTWEKTGAAVSCDAMTWGKPSVAI